MNIRKQKWNILGLSAALMLFWAAAAFGQDITAGMRGTVADQSGAVVAGAKVVARNVATSHVRDTVTDTTGSYVFTLLPVGPYELTVTMAGFKKFVQTGILLTTNQVAGVNVTLELGAVSQQVEVKASAIIVNTQTSETSTLQESRQIRELPLNGRNPVALATLTNGVQGAAPSYLGQVAQYNDGTAGIQGGGAYLYVNGNRGLTTEYQLDGGRFGSVSSDQPFDYPNPDALQEFRMITSNYGADYGKLPGGVLNVVTKSGTNQIHGTLFEFNRNSALATRGIGNVSKPFLNQNQFGVNVGGPVIKDKLFAFGTYQWLRIFQQVTGTNSGLPLPNAAERTGDFTHNPVTGAAVTALLKDPLNGGQPFAGDGQHIPANRMDPLAMQMLTLLPLPNQPNGAYYITASGPVLTHLYFLKTDYQVNTKNRASISVMRDHTATTLPWGRSLTHPFVGPLMSGPTIRSNGGEVSNFIANDTHVFRPNLLNQFRFGYIRLRALNGTAGADSGQVHPTMKDLLPSRWPNYPQIDRPSTYITGREFRNNGYWGTSNTDDYQIQDKISYIRGGHNLKVGGEYRYANNFINNNAATEGIYYPGYLALVTGNALADWETGNTAYVALNPTVNGFYQHSFATYIQDDYKVNRRLVVNAGVRWAWAPPWQAALWYHTTDGSAANGFATWNPGQTSVLFPNSPKGVVYPGDPGIPAAGSYTPLNNLAPRAGFGWDIFGNGKTSLRGGFGLFITMPARSGAQNGVVAPFNPQGGYIQSASWDPAKPTTSGFEDYPPVGTTWPAPAVDRTISFDKFEPYGNTYIIGLHPENPHVYQYNLTLERELGRGVVLSAGYVGMKGRRLPWYQSNNPAVYIPGNGPDGKPLSTVANEPSRRVLNLAMPPAPGHPYQYGILGTAMWNGFSNYDSLQVQVRSRDWHGMTMQAAYTWSHSIDTAMVTNGGMDSLNNTDNQDPNCFACNKGNSPLDYRHNLVLSYTYHSPSLTKALHLTSGVGSGVAKALLDDWGFSGINNFRTGYFGTILSNNLDSTLTGVSHDRGQLVAGAGSSWQLPMNRPDADKRAHYFDQTKFVQASPGVYGNLGRGIVSLPGSWGMDFSALKHFPFGPEGQREVEFRCEFYNFLNHHGLNSPNLSVGAPSFGTIVGQVGGARFIQLGLKFMF